MQICPAFAGTNDPPAVPDLQSDRRSPSDRPLVQVLCRAVTGLRVHIPKAAAVSRQLTPAQKFCPVKKVVNSLKSAQLDRDRMRSPCFDDKARSPGYIRNGIHG
jgi:hypothetical protein